MTGKEDVAPNAMKKAGRSVKAGEAAEATWMYKAEVSKIIAALKKTVQSKFAKGLLLRIREMACSSRFVSPVKGVRGRRMQ